MSQISGDYNSQNPEEWPNFNNKGELSDDPSSIDKNFLQNLEGVVPQSPTSSFGNTAHTEESLLRSAVLSDQLTDLEFKKTKYKDAIDTTKPFAKLRYKWNKAKASAHTFLNSFGRRRSLNNSESRNPLNSIGVFVKNRESSSLPVADSITNKESSHVSPEMLSLYMDGIKLGSSEISQEEGATGKNSTFFSENNSTSPGFLDFNFSVACDPSQYPLLSNVINYGQLSHHENINESTALFRRIVTLHGSLDHKEEETFSSLKNDEFNNEILDENMEEDSEKNIENSTKMASNNSVTKKTNTNKPSKSKKSDIKKLELFHISLPMGEPLGSISGSWVSSSSSSFRIPQSGSRVIPSVNFSLWGRKNDKFLDSSPLLEEGTYSSQENVNKSEIRFQKEVSTGISNVYDDETSKEDISATTSNTKAEKQEDFNLFSLSSKVEKDEGSKDFSIVSSALSFYDVSGFSAESLQKQEEEKLLSAQKKAAVTANILTYQYRALGIDPPIVLRKPSSYLSKERPYIVQSSPVEETHNEQNSSSENNFSSNDKRKGKN